MKKFFLAIIAVILILMNTVAYLILYKKYNDIVDYFNQDSQLITERLEGLDAKVSAIKSHLDEIAGRVGSMSENNQAAVDDKINASQDRISTAMSEVRRELSSKVDVLNNELAALKEKISVKQQSKK